VLANLGSRLLQIDEDRNGAKHAAKAAPNKQQASGWNQDDAGWLHDPMRRIVYQVR
jgi:hypothetical protein